MPQYDTDNIVANTVSNGATSFLISEVWVIVSVLLAVIGGIFLYNTFFSKNNESKLNGIKKVIYDFINFKFTIIEPIFRVLYLIVTIALTLSSLALITTNFFKFLGIIVFGNIVVRLVFELLLLTLKLMKDISEINSKLDNNKFIEKTTIRKLTKKDKELDI